MIYMYANLPKFWSCWDICFKGPKMAIQPRFQTAHFAEICLSDSHFEKAITSSMLGYCLCISTWSQCKVYRAPWSIPCPQWSYGKLSIAVATRLMDHNSVKLDLTRNLWNNSKSVEIWGKCQLGKVFQIYFPTSMNVSRIFLNPQLFNLS
jgi:hypothetical protein